MATLNNLFRKLLNVNTAVFSNMRIETSSDCVVTVYGKRRSINGMHTDAPSAEGSARDTIREAEAYGAGGHLIWEISAYS